MEFFRGVLTALVFTSFVVLLFLGGFVLGKAYREEAIPERCDETSAPNSNIGTGSMRYAVSNLGAPQAIYTL